MTKYIWIGVIIVALIGLIFLGKAGASVEPPFEAGILHPMDNVRGNLESSVVVMEYSDFQCPACKTYYPVTRQLMTEFEDRVIFVYRHFPLTNVHSNAEFAARAAEAAGRQGKFWEMHDLLFEKQGEWSTVSDVVPMFETYATLLGISVDRFDSDLGSSEVKNFVKAQKAHAIKSGLQGTPTFFVNGQQIENPTSVDQFRTIINNALNSQ